MRLVTQVLIFLVIIATALPMIDTHHWWIRIFDFPRAQITFFTIVALGLTLYYYRREKFRLLGIAVFLLAAIVYQSRMMVRYIPLYPTPAAEAVAPVLENTVRILMYNVKMDNGRYDDFIQLVAEKDPDIILLTEPDHIWAAEVEVLKTTYPYHLVYPLDNTYGMILYSKLDLEETEINFLVKDDIPSMVAQVKLPSGASFKLHCLHPEPPKPGTDTYERDTEILLVGQRVIEKEGPVIIAGDLNDVAWSRTSERFQQKTNMLDLGRDEVFSIHIMCLYPSLDILWTTFSIPRISCWFPMTGCAP
ncbi:endonuclease/exonuclease/phosphatase family protein [Litoribacter populi]|uniref:endonuclease/exonuclease/phosphatase family protein n=1 Tax=Litoribacter populi TaxID=2598460 RepID=UPI00118011D3|nr:endonuclease/exonuclease/phosphatase family protein [Litoribacter populi]